MKAEALSAETIFPCLLDRLCDQNPEEPDGRESATGMSLSAYRQTVLRDLGWLLNSAAHPSGDRLEDFPEVATSVLNFGTPDLTGKTVSSVSKAELESDLRLAILRFEPRMLADSLVISLLPSSLDGPPNQVNFEIRALLWGNPIPEPFFLKTHIDLETGQCAL